MDRPPASSAGAWWLACGLSGSALWVLLFALNIPADPRYSICAWRRLLDLSCPGCGLTRAFSWLAKGDWQAALQVHPLAPALALEGLGLWLWWGWRLLRKKDGPSPTAVQAWAWTHLFALLFVWILRLLTGTLPA